METFTEMNKYAVAAVSTAGAKIPQFGKDKGKQRRYCLAVKEALTSLQVGKMPRLPLEELLMRCLPQPKRRSKLHAVEASV